MQKPRQSFFFLKIQNILRQEKKIYCAIAHIITNYDDKGHIFPLNSYNRFHFK